MSAAIWTRDMRPTRLSRETPLEPSDSEQRPFWKTISLGKRPTSQPSCLRTNGKARDDGPVASDHVPTTRLARRMRLCPPAETLAHLSGEDHRLHPIMLIITGGWRYR